MRKKLSIPKSVRVGFQNREDTYTGKLAYIISLGKTGERKVNPSSWEHWKDDKIPVQEFENVPTEGFVLNKDVGGTQRSYDWNARREKVRVYDPRDFEFEITVENVLLILQECSSIKGKGLEGKFVLSWSGSNVVLLPVDCEEYRYSVGMAELEAKKISKDEMKEGCTYLTKDNREVMYMGKMPWFDINYTAKHNGSKYHIFLLLKKVKKPYGNRDSDRYLIEKGFTKIAERTNEDTDPRFPEEYDKLMKSRFVSPPCDIVLKDVTISHDNGHYGGSYMCALINGDIYSVYLRPHHRNMWYGGCGSKPQDFDLRYDISLYSKYQLEGETIVKEPVRYNTYDNMTEAQVNDIIREAYVVFKNGSEYKLDY